MRKFIRSRLPSADSIQQISWLQPIAHWLRHPNLWHLHRRSVAGGVALGLFCGLVPGPLQMLSTALLAIWLRVNLPVALVTTFYTNPFTIVPLYLLAYEIGAKVLGETSATNIHAFPELHLHDWFDPLWSWLLSLGKPILIGLPLLGVGLALIGYVLVRLGWRLMVVWKWKHRKSY
jgi:hypothetical protein